MKYLESFSAAFDVDASLLDKLLLPSPYVGSYHVYKVSEITLINRQSELNQWRGKI